MSAGCAAFIRADCTRWYDELEAAFPTAVFRVIGPDGHDVADARVRIDDEPAIAVDGRAMRIEPGPRRIEASLTNGTKTTVNVVILEGQKNRPIDIVLPRRDPERPPPGPPPPARTSSPSGIPTLTWVLGGTSIAGLAMFAGFGLLSVSSERDLRERCSPVCSSGEVGEVRDQQIVADIGLAIGVLALAGAAVVYFTRPAPAPAADMR
jgi:hypothetical protein